MHAVYGIIGHPLDHSFSPAYFREKFSQEGINADYKKFDLKDIEEFPALIQSLKNLKGLNVTIPYKTEVIKFLDALSIEAREIGAVNCIKIANERTTGYNTDAAGFERSLTPLLKPSQKKALILGSGGASLAVKYVLDKIGLEYLQVSRTNNGSVISYKDLNEETIQQHHLIINTTPLGMFPDTDTAPDIFYSAITKQYLLYDLVYNPIETKFLSLGKQRGAVTKNGLEMLHIQAEESWRIWNQAG